MTERVLDDGARLVTVTARGERPVGSLDLCGELPCWQQPIAMTRAGAVWQARVRVAPGIYEIKARDPAGAWIVDPAWRTVARDGAHNGVLVVGGTDEPVLHAAAQPYLVAHDDGRVAIRAGLRHGHGERLAVRVDDGNGAVVRPMRHAGDDESHRWFELELGAAARSFEYELVLADGRTVTSPDGALRLPRAEPLPAWWRDAVVYTIFVDRFRRAGGTWADDARWDRDHHAGGDLDGVIEALPYLAELGVTALHVTPICIAASQHRYDARDPIAVDPALGGEPALARLIEAAHARDLRILLDIAATHVDREFAPFVDVRARGPASPYWRWFKIQRWPFVDGPDPGYAHYQHGQWREPLLATDEPEVQDAIVGWFVAWARRGVDGLRVDAAADLPRPLLARIRAAVRAVRADAVVFGEVVPACLDRFTPGALDAATDFPYREALVGWLAGGAAARLVDVAAAQRRRGAASPRGLGFTGTHDQPRIATVVGDRALARLGLVATALGARVPLLYYGDELDLASDDAARAFEDSWPDRQPMPWGPRDRTTYEAVRAALALRRAHAVLTHGDEIIRADGDATIVVRRHRPGHAIEIAIHRGDEPRELALPAGPARLVFAVGDAALVADDPPTLRLGPRALAVVDRRADPDAAGEHTLRLHNAAVAAQAFVAGRLECPAYPTRLYVTVTEACNLRCRHCITDAPARTTSGRARSLQPWLLDALDDAFAHVDYVAFTHGGESITAPIFPEVLRRIARARRRPGRTTVHLISNGTLLDPERLASLVDLGVTSIMVSLDGATAATNDHVRVLGRFDRVVEHLAAATAWRARHGVDLRLGISTVVGARNVGELPALARLARELGVDWLKLEETYPATAYARHDALAPGDPALALAVAAVRDVVGDEVVVVDHLAPPGGCGCGDDPDARAFRAADDFANRVAFRPCRMAWEQAAIDPDGTVHAVDYAGAALGSLIEAPLLALWNGAPAMATRARALVGTDLEQRRRCVATTPLI